MNEALFELDVDGERLVFELCDEIESGCSYRALSDGEEWARVRFDSRERAIAAAHEMRQVLETQRGRSFVTARHEAAHAVAALHYDIPLDFTTLRRRGPIAGTTRMMPRNRLTWTIAICCGPLAERGWDQFSEEVQLCGTDEQQVGGLGLQFNQRIACELEAARFVSDPEVRLQIDRVAEALMQRKTLSGDEVREISKFGQRLCSVEWQ
jgi:hypothetical protein